MDAKISSLEAGQMVSEYDGSKFFTVSFIKRGDGSLRVMNCRKGVKKHLKGGKIAYDPKSKGLVGIWDAQVEAGKNAYRMISLEAIKSVVMDGIKYIVV